MGSNPVGVTKKKTVCTFVPAVLFYVQLRDSNMEPRNNFRIFADDCVALCAALRKQSEKPCVAFQRVGRTGGNPVGVTSVRRVRF